MNIWVEYWERPNTISLNTHAQMRENTKWVEPVPKQIHRRFCQNMEEAHRFAERMQEKEYHKRIKQDGSGY